MIIGIDGTCLLGERTGAGWYLTHLLEALSHVLEEDRAYVWLNGPSPEEKARVSENRFISLSVTHYPWAALRLTWNTLGTPSIETLIGRPADVYFYPNFLSLPQKQGKKVLFVHDLTHLTHPQWVPEETGKNQPEHGPGPACATLVSRAIETAVAALHQPGKRHRAILAAGE